MCVCCLHDRLGKTEQQGLSERESGALPPGLAGHVICEGTGKLRAKNPMIIIAISNQKNLIVSSKPRSVGVSNVQDTLLAYLLRYARMDSVCAAHTHTRPAAQPKARQGTGVVLQHTLAEVEPSFPG